MKAKLATLIKHKDNIKQPGIVYTCWVWQCPCGEQMESYNNHNVGCMNCGREYNSDGEEI